MNVKIGAIQQNNNSRFTNKPKHFGNKSISFRSMPTKQTEDLIFDNFHKLNEGGKNAFKAIVDNGHEESTFEIKKVSSDMFHAFVSGFGSKDASVPVDSKGSPTINNALGKTQKFIAQMIDLKNHLYGDAD